MFLLNEDLLIEWPHTDHSTRSLHCKIIARKLRKVKKRGSLFKYLVQFKKPLTFDDGEITDCTWTRITHLKYYKQPQKQGCASTSLYTPGPTQPGNFKSWVNFINTSRAHTHLLAKDCRRLYRENGTRTSWLPQTGRCQIIAGPTVMQCGGCNPKLLLVRL